MTAGSAEGTLSANVIVAGGLTSRSNTELLREVPLDICRPSVNELAMFILGCMICSLGGHPEKYSSHQNLKKRIVVNHGMRK